MKRGKKYLAALEKVEAYEAEGSTNIRVRDLLGKEHHAHQLRDLLASERGRPPR